MENLLLSTTTIGSKELVIVSDWLCYNLISEANQASASIDSRVNVDWEYPFGSWKSGKKISVDLGWNADDKIGMNPLRIIGIP